MTKQLFLNIQDKVSLVNKMQVRLFSSTNKFLADNNDKPKYEKDIEEALVEKPRPGFVKPGHPDYDKLLEESTNQATYDRKVEKFLDRHCTSLEAETYDNELIDKVADKNPSVPNYEIRNKLEEKLIEQRAHRDIAREQAFVSHTLQRADDEQDGVLLDSERSDSGFDSNSPRTPSVRSVSDEHSVNSDAYYTGPTFVREPSRSHNLGDRRPSPEPVPVYDEAGNSFTSVEERERWRPIIEAHYERRTMLEDERIARLEEERERRRQIIEAHSERRAMLEDENRPTEGPNENNNGSFPEEKGDPTKENEALSGPKRKADSYEEELSNKRPKYNEDDDDNNNKPSGSSGPFGGFGGSSGGGSGDAGPSGTSSLKTRLDVFLFGSVKDDNFLSTVDYVIEIEQEQVEMPSLFDIDL